MDSISNQQRTADRLQLIDNEANTALNTQKLVEAAERRRKICLYALFCILLLLVALTCVMIPSAFLIGKNGNLDSLRSENSVLEDENQQLLLQLGNLTGLVNDLFDEAGELNSEIAYLKNVMRVSKENLLDYFRVQFKSFSNRSVEYAQFSFDDSVDWNFGDQICLAVQSQLAFPVATNHESIEDLKSSCPLNHTTNCCSCWIGLSKKIDGITWVDSNQQPVKNLKDLPWASGQPKDEDGYDCAYIRDNLMFSEICSVGTWIDGSNASEVPEKFVCQNIIF
ncbi:uncharacterized protein LOC142334561 [Convolutriloba macropyga]|uniref:uncharacterized protein LOC142334561 n=1 Tax=Convolutriloba macropyga TaxID=536237 RepID=UPI003F528C50